MSEKRYAILMGVNDYGNSNDQLSFSAADVIKLRTRLLSNCLFEADDIYPITSTKDKPHIDIVGAFENALAEIQEKFQPCDTVLFYFSGHGLYSKKGVVLEIKEEKLPLQKVYEMIDTLPAGRQFYIIDACHAGAGAELKSSERRGLSDYANEHLSIKSEGVQILCSCKSGERSRAWARLENSVYTYYLIEAIDSRNFYDRDLQTLSLVSMHEYATKKIDLAGDPQTPVLISKSAGYYPFAFVGPNLISGCEIILNIHKEDEIYQFLQRDDLNLPEPFKRDLSQFMAELSLNLFNHNHSLGLNVIFNHNTIEIHDHSDKGFDPFTAEVTAEGQGIRVYRLFLKKYDKQLQTTYIPGNPNVIKLDFDESVFKGLAADPCYLAVNETFLLSLTPLNRHNYDVDCETLTIDISKSHFPLSICVKMFDELLKRTERKKPLIIIKMAQDDMLREDVAGQIRFRGYDRIVLF